MSMVRKNVVVIGGGFSGTVLAAQLMRRAPHLSITVIDKNLAPGRGLAYGTEYDCHLLNVCAEDMTALYEERDHFLRWAKKNCESSVAQGSFLPRSVYGRYLGALLEESLAASRGEFDWIRDEVSAVHRRSEGYLVSLKGGSAILAQNVVLALGNFPPGNLGIPGLTQDALRYERCAWSKNALDNLSDNDDDEVLLIGSGLTAVDIAIALHSKRFRGKIHVLSRHGLLPQSHKQTNSWPRFWNEYSPKTARALMRLIRNQAEAAAKQGSDWRAVMDSLRPLIQQMWQSLPLSERRRFLRHARAYWEVHRHRVAPEIAGIFSQMMARGQIQIHAGRITNYSEREDCAEVSFLERPSGGIKTLHITRAINCSGPETDCRKIESSLLRSLFEHGLARQDALRLGLDVDRNGAVIDGLGIPSQCLFAIGPACKGLLWESTAVPELRVQAAELADHLVRTALAHEVSSWQTQAAS